MAMRDSWRWRGVLAATGKCTAIEVTATGGRSGARQPCVAVSRVLRSNDHTLVGQLTHLCFERTEIYLRQIPASLVGYVLESALHIVWMRFDEVSRSLGYVGMSLEVFHDLLNRLLCCHCRLLVGCFTPDR